MQFNTKVYMQEDKEKVHKLVETLKVVQEGKMQELPEIQVYKVGDIVKAHGKQCKIVEVLEDGRYHCKNLSSPFDSFVALTNEINTEVKNVEPDLLYREDSRFSL